MYDASESCVVYTFTAASPNGTLRIGRLFVPMPPAAALSSDKKRYSKERRACSTIVSKARREFGSSDMAEASDSNPYARLPHGRLVEFLIRSRSSRTGERQERGEETFSG